MPYSPGGDRNQLAVAIMFWLCKFRYLTPREGTETQQGQSYSTSSSRSDTLLPVRGRKRLWAIFVTIPPTCSDALLPARGRKPVEDSVNLGLDLVQIPFSPWGDENLYGWCSSSGISSFRHLTPRERTETLDEHSLWFASGCSDTFLPVKGRKQITQLIKSDSRSFRYPTPREGTETW